MSKDVMSKYTHFVADYNIGMKRAALCSKYKIPAEKFDSFVSFLKKKGFAVSPRVESHAADFEAAHDIDFEIFGDDAQFVEIELDPGETAIAEAGAMMCMDAEIKMETIFGDGSSSSNSVMGRLFGAGKRILSGESLFMTAFTNLGRNKSRVAFSPSHPGKIIAASLDEHGGELLCQKDAFLCAAQGVSIDIAFQKRLGAGFFGGEGFILQRLRGDGLAFIHAGGMIVERELAYGQRIKLDTGCLVAMQPSVDYDIEYVGSIKSALVGGEGLFLATVAGPGKVWVQSLPFSRLANKLSSQRSNSGGKVSISLGTD